MNTQPFSQTEQIDLILAVSFSKHVRPLIAKELAGGGIYNFVRVEHYIQDPKQFVQVMTCYERTANVMKYRTSRPDVFCKKGVLRNFTKFLGKICATSLYFNKVDRNSGTRDFL